MAYGTRTSMFRRVPTSIVYIDALRYVCIAGSGTEKIQLSQALHKVYVKFSSKS